MVRDIFSYRRFRKENEELKVGDRFLLKKHPRFDNSLFLTYTSAYEVKNIEDGLVWFVNDNMAYDNVEVDKIDKIVRIKTIVK